MAKLSPEDPKCYDLAMDFLRIAITEMPFIGFHSGVKFVPTNSTVWANYPCADNAYNGPWWWWSVSSTFSTKSNWFNSFYTGAHQGWRAPRVHDMIATGKWGICP
jgi:hypothetical protein